MKKIRFSLTTQIVIALVLAIIAGVLLNDHADFVNHYIKPFGTIFLKLLKFIVVPLVLLSIIAGILSMNDMKKLGRLGLRAVLYFMFTTVLAVILGLGLSTLVRGWLPTIDMTSAAALGVFCMLTPVVVENGPSVLGSYAALVVLAYACFITHTLCVYSPLVYIFGRQSPLKFLKEMQPTLLFAFSSDSSVATLPYSMKCTEKLGVKKDIGSFVLSLGATINMDGVAIYLGVASVFMATCCGIDRIIDMGRTVMSVTGDASCAVVMQNLTDSKE